MLGFKGLTATKVLQPFGNCTSQMPLNYFY